MKPLFVLCAAMIFTTTSSFAAAMAAENAVVSSEGVQVRGSENRSSLQSAVSDIAASQRDKDALTKAIVVTDAGAARGILSRNGYTPSVP